MIEKLTGPLFSLTHSPFFFHKKLSWYTTRYIPAFPTKKTNYSANDPVKCMAMLWETNEFAKLLTLVDNFFYRQVKPDTYLHLMQIPATKQSGAQNVALKAILDYVTWFRLVRERERREHRANV